MNGITVDTSITWRVVTVGMYRSVRLFVPMLFAKKRRWCSQQSARRCRIQEYVSPAMRSAGCLTDVPEAIAYVKAGVDQQVMNVVTRDVKPCSYRIT